MTNPVLKAPEQPWGAPYIEDSLRTQAVIVDTTVRSRLVSRRIGRCHQ